MTSSVAVSALMLTGKITAFWLTRSAAILADAAESVVHTAATGLAAFSLWFAAKRPDVTHPYGHGRVAYFSIGFEGALIFCASLGILWSGVHGLLFGVPLRNLGLGMGIASGLAVLNLALGLALIKIGKHQNAIILVSNGKHVLSDVWTTVAAVLGVGLVILTGVHWLDPVTAMAIGFYVMATGVALLRKSLAGLMDELDPELAQQIIVQLQEQVQKNRIVDFHQLRCRRINDEVWIEVHLLVPGDLTTTDAHSAVTRVEEAIQSKFPPGKTHITSHIEPSDHEKAHPGGHADLRDPLKRLE